ncbi:hypothetical protein H2200_010768 [Cladophialophora chaetospira]|uniref:NAD(P)-binding protein n=1 Tax=Cladophialophora chaetospira TaxID=386627 RepID=A0AA39CDW5_9EURO|nr:hypothetical protein H2200_010768 [Cladophialophora chaetospira]
MFDRYADVHKDERLDGPGDARPTALQIVKDNDLVGGMADKAILITGTSSGLGIETARALKATGAKLYLTVRDLKKGQEALKDILEPGRVELLHLDLNSLDSARSCAQEFLQKSSILNVLINNAGIMMLPERTLTVDGFEAQLGVNYLAHFVLFQCLKPTLLQSATAELASRVICVSSSGHNTCGINFNDLQLEAPGAYTPSIAYGQSKTATIYMSNEIDRRYGSKGIHSLSLHPGGIWTGLQIHMDTSKFKGNRDIERTMKNCEQGAATTVWAAIDREWEGQGGKYLSNCQNAAPASEIGREGYAAWAYDAEAEARLWTEACRLVGVEDDD